MFNIQNIQDYKKPYIIAEIGANHNGDMKLAKALIDKAKECGADCAKFQSWTKDSIFSKKTYEDNFFLGDDYRNRTDYSLEQIVDKYHIGREEHIMLSEYCNKIGIDFNSTPFSKQEADLLVDELNVPFIKVASMDVTNTPFLKYLAQKKKPIVLSTGLCDISDISRAVYCLRENGCNNIVLLHCVAIYPPKDEDVNLNCIDTLRMVFKYPIGYSDHTMGVVAPILAMGKGACIIEKHFTLDKEMEGWDHKVSANPVELKQICDAAKTAYKMLGTTELVVAEDEDRRNAFQRSIVAAKFIPKGKIILESDLDFKRPGTGISPQNYEFILGKVAKRDIEYDEIIQFDDF